MSFFTGLMETLCGYALAWGANVAVFTVFLCLTGRFWQRNAAPALRRAPLAEPGQPPRAV